MQAGNPARGKDTSPSVLMINQSSWGDYEQTADRLCGIMVPNGSSPYALLRVCLTASQRPSVKAQESTRRSSVPGQGWRHIFRGSVHKWYCSPGRNYVYGLTECGQVSANGETCVGKWSFLTIPENEGGLERDVRKKEIYATWNHVKVGLMLSGSDGGKRQGKSRHGMVSRYNGSAVFLGFLG